MYENVQFYLKNDIIRKKIATSGLERIKRDFTFKERLRKMLIE